MNSFQFFNDIENLIADNCIKFAIQELRKLVEYNCEHSPIHHQARWTPYKTSLILLSQRWQKYKTDEIRGVITPAQSNVISNQIITSLLFALGEMRSLNPIIHNGNDSRNNDLKEVHIILDHDFDGFSGENQETFLMAITNLLNMNEQLAIKIIRPGSVYIIFDLPAHKAQELKLLIEDSQEDLLDNFHFKEIKIQALEATPIYANQDTHIFLPGGIRISFMCKDSTFLNEIFQDSNIKRGYEKQIDKNISLSVLRKARKRGQDDGSQELIVLSAKITEHVEINKALESISGIFDGLTKNHISSISINEKSISLSTDTSFTNLIKKTLYDTFIEDQN